MRTSSKVIGAAAAAALVVAGGSAFTAANTVPTTVVAGYGSSTVSGVEVAEMQIVPSGANVGSVVYTVEAANVSSYTFALSGDATDSACAAVYSAPDTTITCEPDPAVTIAEVDTLNLTATNTATTP